MAITVGFRFLPTDEELVTYFLFNKIFAQTDPFNDLEKFSVREGDLYGSQDPRDIWSLYGGDNLEDGQPLYFFTRLKKVSSNGSRISRRVGSGTWAGEDSGDTITSQNYVVGVKKRFRYENKKSPDNGAWIMHEFAVDPSLLKQYQKPDDIVLCRMKKNPVAEKKKRKLQQVLNSEPWMSSKHSKLVEPQPVPISVQQYQQQAEFNSHTGSNILQSETEVVDSRLMFDPDQELLFSLEEEDSRLMFSPEEEELLLNGTILEQLLDSDNISDDEPCMCSMLVEPPPVPISVQQEAEFNSQHTGSNIETEPLGARSLEEEELLYSIELDQLLESDDEPKAAETQEISAAESSPSTIDPADTTSLMFDPQEFLLDGFEEEEFLLYSPDQLLQGV
ncbi:hypothetical protein EZV62_009821 [Acer yangbiense]|uniref:NAC domain-containing protein n=1 Tax=Acer yangbiense TaxID=1000413 RepID=A0A5C7I0N2_9ROSI|nr:hypothetical protein EZV62_009821 [Acer yangbiense]